MPLVALAPDAVQHFTDSSGNLLVGGQLYTYAAGTMTKLATYTDASGATPNTNPVILNSRGECSLWLAQGAPYKLILSPVGDTDPPSNPIWTQDNVVSLTGLLAATVSVGVPGTGTVALTTAQLQNQMIKLTGTLTGNLTVTIPAGVTGQWTFFNQTTGNFSVTLATTAPPIAGTSTGSNASNTLNDISKAWTTSAFVGATVTITGGTGIGQSSIVLSNSATQLVTQTWSAIPDATSTYSIAYPTTALPQFRPISVSSDGNGVVRVDSGAGTVYYATVGGTADAIALTVSPPAISQPAGTIVWFIATANNLTTTPTAQLGALAALTIQTSNAQPLAPTDIQVGYLYGLLSTGSNWLLISTALPQRNRWVVYAANTALRALAYTG